MQFEQAQDALDFILGGNATFTATSVQTGKHFTFKVRKKDEESPYFVSVLNGPDNWANYEYIGFVPKGDTSGIVAGKKGHPDAKSYKAFRWILHQLNKGEIPPELVLQHEGKCGACGRKLTHPSSIDSGFGPECAKRQS